MIYVDNATNPFPSAQGVMKTCHLLADSEEELHSMAEKLELKRSWFQPAPMPHYDIAQSKRAVAVSLGAVQIGRDKVAELFKKHLAGRN